MHKISVSFEEANKNEVVLRAGGGQILLQTLLENGIVIRHDCGGICACATCHIYVESGASSLEPINRREMHFLKKAVGVRDNSRLACQCIFAKGTAALQLTIPNQTAIPPIAKQFIV